MKLKITDFTGGSDLSDAIGRYHVLLQMTFSTNIYKVIETPDSQIYRFRVPETAGGSQVETEKAVFGITCSNCSRITQVQADLAPGQELTPGHTPFPSDDRLKCGNCGTEINLLDARRQIESQAKKPIIERGAGANG